MKVKKRGKIKDISGHGGFWLQLRESESDIDINLWHHRVKDPNDITHFANTVIQLVNWYSKLGWFGKFVAAWLLGLPKYEIEATEKND